LGCISGGAKIKPYTQTSLCGKLGGDLTVNFLTVKFLTVKNFTVLDISVLQSFITFINSDQKRGCEDPGNLSSHKGSINQTAQVSVYAGSSHYG
jgi:hypothetical protein